MVKKLTTLVLLLLVFGCAFSTLPDRYHSSGLNGEFSQETSSFADYVKHTRNAIEQARVDLTPSNHKIVVEDNSPFDLKPPKSCIATTGANKTYRRGVLLIHGLSGSPYVMRQLGYLFQKKCFRVMAILLPGNGTRPGDLSNIKWEEWNKAVRYGVAELSKEVDEVYIAGYSVGGTLAIYESLHNSQIKGLFLFSPAIKITSLARVTGILNDLGRFFSRLQWLSLAEDGDQFRYESVAMNAPYQVYRLIETVQKELSNHRLNMPVFLTLSQDDATVDSEATIQFFLGGVSDKNKHMVLYTANPNSAPSNLLSSQVELVNSYFPKEKILSSAHTAILIPQEDPYYGLNGSYTSCIHYSQSSEKYHLCKQKHYDFSGEITAANLKKGIISRLMYNPNFDQLKASLLMFIDKLDTSEMTNKKLTILDGSVYKNFKSQPITEIGER